MANISDMSKSFAQAQKYIGKMVTVTIDRLLGSKHPKFDFEYPVNYGYLKNEIAPDGGGLDAYILGVHKPLDTFEGVCIAIVHRNDDDNDKLVVVEKGDTDWTDEAIAREVAFQEKWFDSVIVRH